MLAALVQVHSSQRAGTGLPEGWKSSIDTRP